MCKLRCLMFMASSVVSARWTLTIATGVLACIFGCRSHPTLVPHIGVRDPVVMAKEAPIVVVGIAKSVTTVASCRTFDSSISAQESEEKEWPLSLKLVSLQVENVLKGLSDAREVSFYRYEWCGDYIRNGSPEVGSLNAGGRAVYFLRTDKNNLRAFNDYTYTHLRLWSGRHENAGIQGNSMEERLVWLMITPGQDMDGEAFAETLRMQVIYGYGLAPQHRIFREILSLLDHPNPLVQAGACLAVAWNFSGRNSCLQQPYITSAPKSLSWAIEGARNTSKQREDVLRRVFLTNPSRWIRLYPDSCDDELDILSLHEDSEVADSARSAIDRECTKFGRAGVFVGIKNGRQVLLTVREDEN